MAKADGSTEPFDRAKLTRSLLAAGAGATSADEVAGRVEGELKIAMGSATTREVRAMVMEQLARRDPEAAERYEQTRRPVVRRAIEATKGVARLPPAVMASMRLRDKGALQLSGGQRTLTMVVEVNERTLILGDEIRLNAADMKRLGVRDGDRILARRAHNDVGYEGMAGPGPTDTANDHGDGRSAGGGREATRRAKGVTFGDGSARPAGDDGPGPGAFRSTGPRRRIRISSAHANRTIPHGRSKHPSEGGGHCSPGRPPNPGWVGMEPSGMAGADPRAPGGGGGGDGSGRGSD